MVGSNSHAPAGLRMCLPLLLMGTLGLPQPTVAQDGPKTVVYNHLRECPEADRSEPCQKSYRLSLEDGEPFRIVIEDTDSTAFTFEVAGIEVPTGREPGAADVGHTVRLVQTHDDRFGGYVVRIRHQGEPNDPERGMATLTIRVRTLGWSVGFGGGFTASGLTDPVFVLDPADIGQDGAEPVVARQEDREDEAKLGLANFVHLFHTGFPHLSASFGLGVTDGSGLQYYFGPSFRVGGRAALTAGVTLGQKDALPPGERLGRPPQSESALSNLDERTDLAWFVGLSYSFLGGGAEDLQKPFAGSGPGSTATVTRNGNGSGSSGGGASKEGDGRDGQEEGGGGA